MLVQYNSLFNKNIETLKPKQVECLNNVVSAVTQDNADMVFVLLRTGYGKTLVGKYINRHGWNLKIKMPLKFVKGTDWLGLGSMF